MKPTQRYIIGIDPGYEEATVHMAINENGDIFQIKEEPRTKLRSKAMSATFGLVYGHNPLPHIEPGDPLVLKPLNDVIDRVNQLQELIASLEERFPQLTPTGRHPALDPHKLDISMGCSMKKEPENTFIDHNTLWEMHKKGYLSEQTFRQEYLNAFPPPEDPPIQDQPNRYHPHYCEVPFGRRRRLFAAPGHDIGLLFYACQDCHELVLQLPIGQLRSVKK